jgi:hypothetical protein
LNAEKLLIIGLLIVLNYAAPMWLSWRALSRFGLSPWLSLLVVVPGVGILAVMAIVAFADLPVLRRASD